MPRLLASLLILAALSACQKLEPSSGASAPTAGLAEETRSRSKPDAQQADKRSQYMAYEHSIQMDTEEQKVTALHEVARAACLQDVQNQCVVLQSSIASGNAVSASLRLRAKAEGIRQIIALLGKQGTVVKQSTRAEDLAGPIEDAAKKLAMLTDYRTRLEGLRERAGGNIDALIKVNQQLSEVQSQIEAMTGDRARMMQRVETETLTISISAVQSRSFWKPVSVSLSSFSADFSTAIAGAVTAVAYLIPYGTLFLIFLWVLVKLWRRWRRPGTGA